MYATDFLFDEQRASDFGCMICSFDDNIETSGGEIEYIVSKPPDNDVSIFYGSQFNSVITWKFSICKNPCKFTSMYFNQYEESMIMKWLVRTDGYKFLQFEQKGYEDIFYRVYINAMPHYDSGKVVGFDLTVTSDCAYGFTDIIKKKASISSISELKFQVYSDINSYILPTVKINGTGNFHIKNAAYLYLAAGAIESLIGEKVELKNVSGNIMMDSATDMMEGISDPDDFNWHFLKLVDGINTITTNSASDIEIEISYREPRYVRV